MNTIQKVREKKLHLVKVGYTGHMIDHTHKLIHHVENGHSCHKALEALHHKHDFAHDIKHHLELGHEKCKHCFPHEAH